MSATVKNYLVTIGICLAVVILYPLPAELEKIARMVRSENLELLSSTQHPRDYHRDLRAE